ncbi:MAG: hypothetical protein JO103_13815 [Candidatus Eremiobacteraeota bacterium]|nr:hypothetical protein [Candidatus Eremiobacteraeota bacterium]MBV9409071.1 hypothetical protein [Candidatus Eremiobacteraeota bacterium]
MLTYEQALAKAREEIAAFEEPLPSRDIVVVEDRVQERARGWVFPYQTRAFLETHDPRQGLLGMGPIFVDKLNGSVHVVPTGGMKPWIEEYDRTGVPPKVGGPLRHVGAGTPLPLPPSLAARATDQPKRD